MFRRHRGRRAVWRCSTGNHAYFGELQLLAEFLCEPQMAVMYRVERASKDADGSCHVSVNGPRFTAYVLEYKSAYIRQHARQERNKTRTLSAVDHTMVVGERQRQHQPRREFFAV